MADGCFVSPDANIFELGKSGVVKCGRTSKVGSGELLNGNMTTLGTRTVADPTKLPEKPPPGCVFKNVINVKLTSVMLSV
jgi:hypothetical protein